VSDFERKIMKAPTEKTEYSDILFPKLASIKLDGIRALVKSSTMFSSKMHILKNTNLQKFVDFLNGYPEWIFDGELYSHGDAFSSHQSVLSYSNPLPENMCFYIFDMVSVEAWNNGEGYDAFEARYKNLLLLKPRAPEFIKVVEQVLVNDVNDVKKMFDKAVKAGYEGLMLRDPQSPYKHGRSTKRQNYLLKLKKWIDYDAKIISVEELKGIKDGIPRDRTPTGRLKPVYKKAHLEGKGTFGHFVVELDPEQFEPGTTMIIGSWKGLTRELRDEIWGDPDKYIGEWIRFKGQHCGVKDRPRIPKEVEFRDPK